MDKMNEIVRKIYGGEGVELPDEVREKVEKLEQQVRETPYLEIC